MSQQLTITAGGKTLVYDLKDSGAVRELLSQLPLDIAVEDYGGNEKIFYPPQKLNIQDTPLAKKVDAGTLAYYAPWGDVVLFYESFRPAPGLYELGRINSGAGEIGGLTGTVNIKAGSGQ